MKRKGWQVRTTMAGLIGDVLVWLVMGISRVARSRSPGTGKKPDHKQTPP